MNSLIDKIRHITVFKNRSKNLILSIVILVEVLAILFTVSYAWVETVSSIKIAGEGDIDTYVFTEAMIGSESGTIDLADYFKKSGNMHLAPASSSDGNTFYFPKISSAGTSYRTGNASYRKGNVSDKNTKYFSVTFKLQADTNADFFFTQVPTFSNLGSDIRISVTAYSEGIKPTANDTKIYAISESSNSVVNSVNSTVTATASVEAISNHIKGKSSTYRLFNVGADETKIVTINLWLQNKDTDMNSVMSQLVTISNFGITSSLTPRRVTLIPTPTWDVDNASFYAWCWGATNGDASRLYKLELDDNEHYSFDYNGTYQNILFFRSGRTDLTTEIMNENNDAAWTDGNSVWNKTEDKQVPNSPVDPTFVITSMNGSSQTDPSGGSSSTAKKSTGDWVEPSTVKVAYITDQDSDWGTLTATSYIGTSTSTNVMEKTSSSSTKHIDTVHAWPGKKISVKATAKSNYAFVGWYTDSSGTGTAVSTSLTYTSDAPSASTEVVYYAKFKETRTITLKQYIDGSNGSGAGKIGFDSETRTDVATKSKTVDKGASVTLTAEAKDGYTLNGIYTTATGDTSVSTITANSNSTYYARFTTNSYKVTTKPYYTSYNGTSYTLGNTGGTVKTGSASATSGTTTSSELSVKYKSYVTLTAAPASGYGFVGWYNGTASSATCLSTDTSYSYHLSSPSAVTVYARFMKKGTTNIYVSPRENWGNDYYIRLYQDSGTNVMDSDNGFVKANYDSNTGYYKAVFTTIKTGSFSAILAKDTNHTDKVPSSGGYTGTLGTSYIFKYNQSDSALTQYSTQRCIWFIDGTDNHFIANNGAKVRIDNWSNTYDMRSIGSYCYVYEYTTGTDFSNASGITFKRTSSSNEEWNYWNTSPTSGKSQYTATGTGSNNGSWTN